MEKKKSSKFGIGLLVGVLITLAVVSMVAVVGSFFLFRGVKLGSGSLTSEEKLETIKAYLDRFYLGEIEEDALEDALASGMLSGIGDKYAQYYDQKEFQMLMEESAGIYCGIGISVITTDSGEIEVVRVFSGTPAEEAGIKAGDIILEADGEKDFESLDDLVKIVRGEEGMTVDLVVKQGKKEVKKTVTRRQIEIDTVYHEMLENKIGYIQLAEFDTVSVEQFNRALDELQKEGATALILDLRDNPGGDYDTVMKMADRVLPEGTIATIMNKDGVVKTESSDEEHKITLPMAVLINGNSASASELFSGAIKDYGIATLIGETTYGKGVIQSIFKLSDGSGMKFTTEEYLTPKGNHINGIGVSPDIEVKIPEEAYEDRVISKEEDTQLQKAIEVLSNETQATLKK